MKLNALTPPFRHVVRCVAYLALLAAFSIHIPLLEPSCSSVFSSAENLAAKVTQDVVRLVSGMDPKMGGKAGRQQAAQKRTVEI
jgi:hypothetical protein